MVTSRQKDNVCHVRIVYHIERNDPKEKGFI